MTHSDSYAWTAWRSPPTCRGELRRVGLVHVPELRRRVALSQCEGCGHLVAHAGGAVAWDEPAPPAAVPTSLRPRLAAPDESEVPA